MPSSWTPPTPTVQWELPVQWTCIYRFVYRSLNQSKHMAPVSLLFPLLLLLQDCLICSGQILVVSQHIEILTDKFPPSKSDDSRCSICLLSRLLVTPPFLLHCLFHRLLLSCKCLNPDRHCLGVVMTTIWRSLSVANCCTDMFFMLPCDSISSKHLCSASLSQTS